MDAPSGDSIPRPMPDDTPPVPASSDATPAPDRWEWRKRRVKDFLLCLSLANLLFIQAWFGVLFQEDRGYFNQLPVSAVTLGALVMNILGLAVVLWLASGLVRRRGGRALLFVADVTLCLLLLAPLNFIRIHYIEFAGTKVLAMAKTPFAAIVGLVLIGVFVRWRRTWSRAARAIVAVLVPLAAFTFVQILWGFFHLAEREHPPVGPHPAMLHSAAPDQPRVVWIIFDELDRRVLFDARPDVVALPEFDRLRREALDATNSFAPAGTTIFSMPALTIGRSPAAVSPVSASDAKLLWQDDGKETTWATASNVFTRARSLELNSAIVGWYLPYDRVLASSANQIDWIPSSAEEQARAPDLLGSMFNQIGTIAPFLHVRRLSVQRIGWLLERSVAAAADTNFHLLFLHLPPPHKPGIFEPETGRLTAYNFSTVRGYLNNLLLADRVLGQLRRAIKQSGAGDRTWILVSSDHWWRESHFFDGRTDTRVPFILKAPRDSRGLTYGAAFNTVVSQGLILAILRREVRDHAEAAAWLDRHHVAPPKGYAGNGKPL